jgi:hypothetical protein
MIGARHVSTWILVAGPVLVCRAVHQHSAQQLFGATIRSSLIWTCKAPNAIFRSRRTVNMFDSRPRSARPGRLRLHPRCSVKALPAQPLVPSAAARHALPTSQHVRAGGPLVPLPPSIYHSGRQFCRLVLGTACRQVGCLVVGLKPAISDGCSAFHGNSRRNA